LPVKHRGKAAQAGQRILGRTLVGAVGLAALLGLPAHWLCGRGWTTAWFVLGLWLMFAGFTRWFFRDPDPPLNPAAGLILSPAHGVIDVIDEVTEPEFMAGPCRRISIFLSVFDVHVQNAPVAGRVTWLRRHAGEFLNAMRLESGARNENVLIGFAPTEAPEERVAVRLIAGFLARRILPWVGEGEVVERAERISLIQFGSRVDLYLPRSATLQVRLGQRVRGGNTVLAARGS
jgi:phosphatidylserine decarboxylase